MSWGGKGTFSKPGEPARTSTVQLTVATKVMRAEAPGASEVKVMVRLLPEPVLQIPPAVAWQETKLRPAGS